MMIRAMKASDVKSLIQIHWLSHMDEYASEPYPLAPQGIKDDESLSDLFAKSTIYVYEHEGTVRGFIGYIGHHLIWLYVHPQYRSLRIGKKLVRFMLESCAGEAISLIVVKSNQVALSFYKALGFIETSEFEAMYQGYPIKGLKLINKNLSS